MKHGWTYKKFEDCLEKVVYTSKILSKDYLEEGAFPIVSQEEELISGYWNNDKDLFHIIKPVVVFGDHTRVLKYIDFNFVLGADGVKILQPTDDIKAKFLYYYLKWFDVPSLGYSRHYKLLKECLVPVPPLPVQQQICSLLDKLSRVIEAKKEQLKELDNLAQAIFYDMFGDPITNEKGWEVKKMGDFGSFQRGLLLQKKDFVENGCPCIHYGQLHTSFGAYTTKHLTNISQELYLKSKIAHKGDLILALTSEDVEGSCKSTAWLGDYDIAVGSDAAIFSHNQDGIYLSFYTRTKAFYNEKDKYARGFKVTHIKTSDIATFPICLPPLPLQQAFAEKVEAIERQKELINQSIREVQTLFDSRMDYWFSD